MPAIALLVKEIIDTTQKHDVLQIITVSGSAMFQEGRGLFSKISLNIDIRYYTPWFTTKAL